MTKILINTGSEYHEIAGEHFLPGEHVHMKDDFDVSKFPDIKEAHVVLAERTQKALDENGLTQFAQSVKEDMERYSQAVPEIATTVLKYAPVKVVDEKPVEEVVKL
jgi:hypothetical protein